MWQQPGQQRGNARPDRDDEEFLHTVWETDARGQNYYQSASWYAYVGEGRGSSFGEDWLQFYHPDDRDHLAREWSASLADPARPYDIDVRIRRHDGAYRRFRVSGTPLRAPSGEVRSWIGFCRTVSYRAPSLPVPRDGERTKRAVREALAAYGSRVHLAAAIGVGLVELQRWLLGERVIPAEAYYAMITVVKDHAQRLRRAR